MKASLALALVVVLALAAPASADDVEIPVSTCGQYVPDGAVAVLSKDLSCEAGTRAVTLGRGSTLRLDGRSIVVPDGWGVWCQPSSRCTILGGGSAGPIGSIRDATAGVYLQRKAKLEMSDIAIDGCAVGVEAEDWNAKGGARASLVNVEISGADSAGLHVSRLRLDNVSIHDNPGSGIAGLSSSKVLANGLTVVDNAFSEGCQYYGCAGIRAGSVKGERLVVADNDGIGIHAVSLRLSLSTATGNLRAGVTKDLVIGNAPRVEGVACGVSLGWGSRSQTNWGVCAQDEAP